MDWEIALPLIVIFIIMVIGAIWLIDELFGDGPNRRYLSRYISGANSAIARIGFVIDVVPETREARTLAEKGLVTGARSYSHSVSLYHTLTKRFGLRGWLVTVVGSVGFTEEGDGIVELRDIKGTHIQYCLIRERHLVGTKKILGECINAHSNIIGMHGWGSRIFER